MSPRPWRPPELRQLAALGVLLDTRDGPLEEERVTWAPSHRVIASEYAGINLFDRLTSAVSYSGREEEARALREIADLTNSHALQEAGRIELVRPEDRIYGPGASLIMASFAYPSQPSRFSDGSSGGTYYASLHLETAVAETRYHAERALRGSGPCVTEKTVIHADLDGVLVDIRVGRARPAGVYDPDDYRAGQMFGGLVRQLGGYGIVFDSVRHRTGECVAIFRPPVLGNARAVDTLHFHWDGTRIVEVS